MRLVRLTATNFLSFKSLEYDFENKPILIQGENESEDSQESNGAGKSSLQASIEYALFKSSRKVRDVELIHFGEAESLITLSIECPIREQNILIERKIKLKGSGESQLSVNGVVRHAFEDKMVSEIDKFVIDWIGISREDLQNYFIINKERYKSFFSSSNREKIEMINRFSNAKLIDGVDKEVEKDVKVQESELTLLEQNKTSIISKIKTLKEQVDFELNRDISEEIKLEVDSKLTEISNIELDIEQYQEYIKKEEENLPLLNDEIKKIEDEVKSQNDMIKDIEKSLSKIKDIDLSDKYIIFDEKLSQIQEKESKNNSELKKFIANRREIEEILDEINKNIKGAVKCPKCSHEFLVGDPTIDIEEEKSAKIDTEYLLSETKKSIDSVKTILQELDQELEKISSDKKIIEQEESELNRQKRELRQQISSIENRCSTLNTQINDKKSRIDSRLLYVKKQKGEISLLRDKIASIERQIEEIKKKQIDRNRIDSLRDQMRGEGNKLRSLNHSIKNKKIKIFETSQWIHNFKSFNMYLANQSLKVIQGYCNKFLQDIRSDLQIRWEGIKMLASGALKEEITAYIIRDSEQRDFWSFSGGERVRLDYSMILTLQRMINQTHRYGGLDFLSTDEIGEGIDSQGLSDLMKSLSQFDKTILLTTHVVNRNIGDNILLIRKQNGVSQIVKN